MNNIELHAKLPNDLNFTRLDLFGDETITLTQVIQDAKDPAKVFTDFTKTFSIPASKTNNKFFKHYENFTQSITYSFDARKKVDAKIELNSLPFQKGSIRLEGVDLKNGKAHIYKITFFGEQNLKAILGDLKLADLDWLNNFNTTYTSANIITGMSSGGTGTETVDSVSYPAPLVTALISNSMRGFWSSNQTPVYYNTTTQEINKSGGNLNPSQATALSGYYWKDLTFSIRLYIIIKAIENSDITKDVNGNKQIVFSDDFFNDTNVGFYNLYMLCQRNAGKILEGFGSSYTPNQQSSRGYNEATIAADHEEILTLTKSTIRPTGLSSNEFFQFTLTVNFTSTSNTIFVDLIEINADRLETTFTYTTSQSGGTRSYQIGNGTYKLVFRCGAAETIDSFSINLIDTFGTNSTTSIATGDVDASFAIPSAGFTITDNIPDMKIIDFLAGLFKIFNLTATTKNGKTTVDTLNNFYSGGTARDVTEFVDNTTKTVDKALPYRAINFKYEDTGNILAKQHNEQFQKEWGSANYNDDGSLDSNNTTYDVIAPFQHMKFERLIDGTSTKNIQVGHLLDDKQEAYLGKPVLFYPIHLSSSTTPAAEPFNLVTEITGYDAGSSNTETQQPAYWIPSNTPALLNNNTGYPQTIHFGVEENEWNADDTTWSDSLFKKYYQSYIVNVFRSTERLTKIKAVLPLKFLQEFTLADELQINDLKYRINSITTNLQTGESSLELLNGRETVAATGAAVVSITISSTNNANASTACGLTLNTTVYYSGTLGNSTRLFTSNALTTAYTGSGNYHRFPSNYYATIDSNGYVSNYNPCPTLSPVVTTSTASNVTYSSFTLNGNLNTANGTVSARGFYWGTNASYASNTKEAVSGTGTGVYTLSKSSGIVANTPYYVTAYAINQHGEGVGTTESFTTNNQPVVPTVTAEPEDNVGETSFTAELEITNDGGATINGAGFYMGTNSSSATANTHYDISPAPTSTGTKQYDFTGLSASTNYYYWGTATNTFSSTKGVSSSYQQVTTNAAPNYTTHTAIRYHATDPYLACVSTAYQRTVYSSGTGNTFGAGLVIYDNNGLTSLSTNGYYSYQNKVYQVTSGNGTLGSQVNCTTSIRRLRLSAGYPSTSYTSSAAACNSSVGSVYAYYTGTVSANMQTWTDTTLTTKFTGAGKQGYPTHYQPTQYAVKYVRQYYNSTYNFWADIGTNSFVGQIDANGIFVRSYYDFANGILPCP